MKIDVTKTAEENLILQIRATNPTSTLKAGDFTAGVPFFYQPPFGGDARQTSVILTAVNGTGKTGTKLLKYRRLTLDQGQAVPVTRVEVLEADTEFNIQVRVIEALGLIASEVTVSGLVRPADTSSLGNLTVTPKPDGLIYLGDPVNIGLTLAGFTDMPLDEDVTVGDLTGFEAA